MFDEVQKKLVVPVKAKWGGKDFAFKGVFVCATCGSSVIGDEKIRKRKWAEPKRHIYYHCTRKKDYECHEPPVTEAEITKELVRYIRLIENVKPQYIKYSVRLTKRMEHFKSLRDQVFLTGDLDPDKHALRFNDYVKYIMQMGTLQEKRDAVLAIDRQLYLHNRSIIVSPIV